MVVCLGMPPEEAVKIAKAEGLDLVEVTAPPNLQFVEFWNLESTNTNSVKTSVTKKRPLKGLRRLNLDLVLKSTIMYQRLAI